MRIQSSCARLFEAWILRVLLTARPTAYRHLSGQTLDVEANEQHRRLYTFAHLGGHQVGISQLASAQGAPAFRRL